MIKIAIGIIIGFFFGSFLLWLKVRKKVIPFWLRSEGEFIAFLEALLTVEELMYESGVDEKYSGFWHVIAKTLGNPVRIRRIARYLDAEEDEVEEALKVLVKSFLKVDMEMRKN